jgi:hypothetical protein
MPAINKNKFNCSASYWIGTDANNIRAAGLTQVDNANIAHWMRTGQGKAKAADAIMAALGWSRQDWFSCIKTWRVGSVLEELRNFNAYSGFNAEFAKSREYTFLSAQVRFGCASTALPLAALTISDLQKNPSLLGKISTVWQKAVEVPSADYRKTELFLCLHGITDETFERLTRYLNAQDPDPAILKPGDMQILKTLAEELPAIKTIWLSNGKREQLTSQQFELLKACTHAQLPIFLMREKGQLAFKKITQSALQCNPHLPTAAELAAKETEKHKVTSPAGLYEVALFKDWVGDARRYPGPIKISKDFSHTSLRPAQDFNALCVALDQLSVHQTRRDPLFHQYLQWTLSHDGYGLPLGDAIMFSTGQTCRTIEAQIATEIRDLGADRVEIIHTRTEKLCIGADTRCGQVSGKISYVLQRDAVSGWKLTMQPCKALEMSLDTHHPACFKNVNFAPEADIDSTIRMLLDIQRHRNAGFAD